MTALETLIALIAPPQDPAGVPFDWPAIEAALGTPLPSDYKAYCDTYGHGSFLAGWGLWVLTPGTPYEDEDLLGTFYRDLLADHADDHHRPYPEAGGLLPFVQTELRDGLW